MGGKNSKQTQAMFDSKGKKKKCFPEITEPPAYAHTPRAAPKVETPAPNSILHSEKTQKSPTEIDRLLGNATDSSIQETAAVEEISTQERKQRVPKLLAAAYFGSVSANNSAQTSALLGKSIVSTLGEAGFDQSRSSKWNQSGSGRHKDDVTRGWLGGLEDKKHHSNGLWDHKKKRF